MNPQLQQTKGLRRGIIISQVRTDSNERKSPVDKKNKGRYLVYIEGKFPFQGEDEEGSIFCRNRVNTYRINPSRARRSKDEQGTKGSGYYGSYYPLQPGTQVLVRFNDDMETDADIVGINSEFEDDCMPFNLEDVDRDDFWLLLRTPTYDNIIALSEETESQPRNSFHLYYNIENDDGEEDKEKYGGTDDDTSPKTSKRTQLILNESKIEKDELEDVKNGGLHLFTHDNFYTTIDEEYHLAVNRDTFHQHSEDYYLHLKSKGKEQKCMVTIDQNIDFYQRNEGEQYDPCSGGKPWQIIPVEEGKEPEECAKEKEKWNKKDRVNKYTKISLDADVDFTVTGKSKNKTVKTWFKTTFDFIVNDTVKMWFKDKYHLVINDDTFLTFKNNLNKVIKNSLKITANTIDLLIKSYGKITINGNTDIISGGGLKFWGKNGVDITIEKDLDALIKQAVIAEVRNQISIRVPYDSVSLNTYGDLVVTVFGENKKIIFNGNLDVKGSINASGDILAKGKNSNHHSH